MFLLFIHRLSKFRDNHLTLLRALGAGSIRVNLPILAFIVFVLTHL